jgi:hypothetical protein
LEVEMRVASNGRIRRSAEEWKELVSGWRKSGASGREFCRQEGIEYSSLQRWDRKLNGSSRRSEFVPVATTPSSSIAESCWRLEVTLPNGIKLQFQG